MLILQCTLFHPFPYPPISKFIGAGRRFGPWANQWGNNREQLREQHELTQEIGNAITSMPLGDPVDEDELEQDLANLEQEKLDEQMLNTGRVPQGDRIDSVGEGMLGHMTFFFFSDHKVSTQIVGCGAVWQRVLVMNRGFSGY